MNSRIEKIELTEVLEQDAKWWHIYATSFPTIELEPREAILNCLKQKVGLSFRIKHPQDETIGIAHGQFLKSFKAFMLIYLAIDKVHRGNNHGCSLFQFIETEVNAHFGKSHHGIVFEVDRPETFDSSEERLIAERRVQFYERLGYNVIDIDYYQPPLQPMHSVYPMHLMMKNKNLSVEEKQQLVRTIYFEKYCESYGISHVKSHLTKATWEEIKRLNGW